MHLHLHAILIITSSFTPRPAHLPLVPSGTFNRHLPPRGAYEIFRFSNLPPRYLWGLSKPPFGAYSGAIVAIRLIIITSLNRPYIGCRQTPPM